MKVRKITTMRYRFAVQKAKKIKAMIIEIYGKPRIVDYDPSACGSMLYVIRVNDAS